MASPNSSGGGLALRGVTLPAGDFGAVVQRFMKLYTAHLSRRSRPYPGAAETLAQLRNSEWRLAVCTNKLEASARRLLEDLGLLPAFALVAGPDTFGVAKPDPAHLLQCIQTAEADRPAVLVGDSEVDIACARAAGIPVIAAAWGYAQRPLAELSPDAIVSALADVPPEVERLIGHDRRARQS